MTLTFQVLGHELWSLTLDIEHQEIHAPNPVERVVKAFSKAWIKGMI